MDPSEFVLESVMSLATHFAKKGIEITIEKAKEIVERICEKNPEVRGQINVDEMAKNIQARAGGVGQVAYNEETLARFLEIPMPDLPGVTPESLDAKQLYNHVRLEGEFQEWLKEWGYQVEVGIPLAGLRGVEYVPDVYGVFDTLHGQFEVCVSLVCDSPPDEDRVFALLGKIEAYAEAKKSFSYGDIFVVCTPNRFTQGALNAIGLQNEQESYAVFPIDGGDVYVLEQAQTPSDRLEELQDKVRQAEEEGRRSKIKKSGSEKE